MANDDLVEEGRQARVTQANFAALGVELEPKRRFKQRERRRARPCLRRAGHGIERRSPSPLTAKAAEQLWQPPQIHVGGGVEQGLEQMRDRMFTAIACTAQRA